MVENLNFAVIAFGLIAFSLVSGRLQNSVLTPPMVFVFFGCLFGAQGLGLVHFEIDREGIHTLAELTLVLVLFTDAARIDLKVLIRDHSLPIRLLLIGLPLSIGLGTLIAQGMFPAFSIWEAALLATILAPTDAALGQAVLSNPRVPLRVSQALNVESGLNDGMAVPIVLFFASCVMALEAGENKSLVELFIIPTVIAPLVGAAVGYLGGKLVERAVRVGWMTTAFQGIAALGLALIAYAVSELLGAYGFIAAFVAGLVLGNTTKGLTGFLLEFAEAEGQLLVLLTFFIFGAAMVPMAIASFQWDYLLYAVLALTVIRMLPVAVSLIGVKLHWETIAFLGWFGPRGLASILFALVVVEEISPEHTDAVMTITVIAVFFSTYLHGLSAAPGSNWYAARATSGFDKDTCQEAVPVEAMPTRLPRSA